MDSTMLDWKKTVSSVLAVLMAISCGNLAADDQTPASDASATYNDVKVAYFKDLWDTWLNDPTCCTGTELLKFLQNPKNYIHFKNLASNYPYNPQPMWDFDESYQNSMDFLFAWIVDDCNPDLTPGPSQFLSYMYAWISYAQ